MGLLKNSCVELKLENMKYLHQGERYRSNRHVSFSSFTAQLFIKHGTYSIEAMVVRKSNYDQSKVLFPRLSISSDVTRSGLPIDSSAALLHVHGSTEMIWRITFQTAESGIYHIIVQLRIDGEILQEATTTTTLSATTTATIIYN